MKKNFKTTYYSLPYMQCYMEFINMYVHNSAAAASPLMMRIYCELSGLKPKLFQLPKNKYTREHTLLTAEFNNASVK